MSRHRLDDHLNHIAVAAVDASGFIAGMDKASFLGDRRTQNAVVMSLIVMGEASARVMDQYPDFAARHVEVPWRQMRGMRNRITHGYFEVDFEMVWATVTNALPELTSPLSAAREAAQAEDAADPGAN